MQRHSSIGMQDSDCFLITDHQLTLHNKLKIKVLYVVCQLSAVCPYSIARWLGICWIPSMYLFMKVLYAIRNIFQYNFIIMLYWYSS